VPKKLPARITSGPIHNGLLAPEDRVSSAFEAVLGAQNSHLVSGFVSIHLFSRH
jgi:hypothetical protein